jgi:RNA polymerase sigma-70 factor, ECF subfamily
MPSVLTEIEVVIPQLYRYAFALLRNRADADDLVNATLLRALDKLHTLHNLYVGRRHRAQYRYEPFPIDDADNTDMVPAPKEAHARLEDVVRALDRLPEDQRIVVLLVSIEDLSYAETAYVMNVPIGTVMYQLAYGRERLRQLSGDETPPALRLVK